MPKSKEKKSKAESFIQTRLTFSKNGNLEFTLDSNICKSNLKSKSNSKTNPESKEFIAPLPDNYRPPDNLDQYGAPLPVVSESFNIRDKLPFLDKLIEILGTYVLAWLEGVELTEEVKDKMKETLLPYSSDITKTAILSVFNSFNNKRGETIKTALDKLKLENNEQ